MPDIKFWESGPASTYLAGASDYREVACACVKEMHRQVGDLVWDPLSGIASRGLLVRHLVMPNNLGGAEKICEWLATEVSPNTYINVMGQYRPCFRAVDFEDIARGVTKEEVESACNAARRYKLRLDCDEFP
eukprot:TRINITY_DN184_c0_g1_i10.p2 TRINITY_DN184_c0_g1~~TRINITY_DN184_c0_g1_i10.p2  ORF type:complete len:132 (+),score=18.51 TRINITY_DN184_c0_g1_i10:1221-1616(+)